MGSQLNTPISSSKQPKFIVLPQSPTVRKQIFDSSEEALECLTVPQTVFFKAEMESMNILPRIRYSEDLDLSDFDTIIDKVLNPCKQGLLLGRIEVEYLTEFKRPTSHRLKYELIIALSVLWSLSHPWPFNHY